MTSWTDSWDRPVQGYDSPTVSVVLATFNGERYLKQQLDSLRIQTQLPDEVVVVDDASIDSTPGILAEFARTAPFPVEVIQFREHLGTLAAFEQGLCSATGEILVICDQDDRWRPEKIAVMAQRMAERPDALLAFSDAVLIDSGGAPLSRSRWRVAGFGPREWALMVHDPLGQMLARQVVSGCTAAIRRALVPVLLPFPTDLHPALGNMMYDRWISLVAAAAAAILTVPERLVEYRIHAEQQIGIPALPVRRVAPRAALHIGQFRSGGSARLGRSQYHAVHIREIAKRISVCGLDSGDSMLRLRLAEEHLQTRGTLEVRRRRRTRSVGQHLLDEDGYRRFSLGLSTAVADWLR